ncbi:MAG: hypothetical protein ACETVZ_09425 [Phycisphaerae bacterium]
MKISLQSYNLVSFIGPFIPKPMKPLLTFIRIRFSIFIASLKDMLSKGDDKGIPLPPALLRFRVTETTDSKNFLNYGRISAEAIQDALKRINRDVYSFEHVLDFGCGCARVLRWFYDHPKSCHFYGTDVDKEAISWCRKAIPFATFEVNKPLPPPAFP